MPYEGHRSDRGGAPFRSRLSCDSGCGRFFQLRPRSLLYSCSVWLTCHLSTSSAAFLASDLRLPLTSLVWGSVTSLHYADGTLNLFMPNSERRRYRSWIAAS